MSSQDSRQPTARPRPRLAIAYDIGAFGPMDLHASIGPWCDILWLADMADPGLGTMGRLLGRYGDVVDTGGAEPDEIVTLLAHEPFDGVIAFNDRELAVASAAAVSRGLPANPQHVVNRLNDKVAQRDALVAAGIPCPDYRMLASSVDTAEVADKVEAMRFPIVVKPIQGHSSRDVVEVSTPKDLAILIQNRAAAGQPREALIAEELLVGRTGDGPPSLGDYVSVEMVVDAGRPVPLAITGKFAIAGAFRETGNFMPHVLARADANCVLALAVAAAEALGVQSGALHIEIKLTPHGPRIIEVNGRVGGGGIDTLFHRRSGRSLAEVAARTALGLPLDLDTESPERSAGPFFYEFFVQPPAEARRLVSMESAGDVIGVAGAETVIAHRSPGDEIDAHGGSQGYILRVSGTADDVDMLASVPEAITDSARLGYDWR